ncbi:MAG TPA: 4-hydroxyphenylpyruvate dioxygenase [Streptosporangiaceae bacterium]
MVIGAVDHLELYVEDVDEWARQLCQAFGFGVHGNGGPQTGLAGCRSILLRQRDITILLTAALDGRHPAAEYVSRHGDGVAVIAVTVADAGRAFTDAVGLGAVPVEPPVTLSDGSTRVTSASVIGFGDVVHRFVTRDGADGPFAPGVIEEIVPAPATDGLFRAVDHLAVCLPAGELAPTVQRYQEVFGFTETFEERIIVGAQAMDSKVVQNPSGGMTLTILEPDTTRAPGQIDEFVRSHDGAGVQHIAFLADDITMAVREISGQGVRFLSTPASYYEALPARLGPIGVPVGSLQELNILADRDRWGVMLQIFTESRHPRRTLFYEVIDRRGARSFGSNNIKALYEAVERQRAVADVAGP